MKLDDNREYPYDFGNVQIGGPSIAGGDPILGQNSKLRKVYASELSQRVKKRSFTKETTSPGGIPPRVRVKTVFSMLHWNMFCFHDECRTANKKNKWFHMIQSSQIGI